MSSAIAQIQGVRPGRGTGIRALFLVLGLLAGCGAEAVISAGSSTPLAVRTAPGPFDGLRDRTAIPAFEYGACDSDFDCAPRGCEGAVCATIDDPAVCSVDPVSTCLARVGAQHCGCVEGVCRWARSAPVLQCARLGADPAGNRGFRGVEPDEPYPIRLGE